ncbi:MAG: 50S ribosomal protein L7/L12 [candidate division Zixibacteria bacterium DG_27]|nr:MAG: 50S ribosomal protein L7/L12 [candidate division Zixibacteria bacterium DG_27]
MTAMELADLSKRMQEEFGVTPAVAVAGVAAAPGAAEGAPAEEKTTFDVVLSAVGDKKIQVIKVVRELTSLGLKEAKEVVDNAPRAVKEAVSREDAEAARDKLQEVGATVELK